MPIKIEFKLENKLHIQVHTHLCMEEQVLSVQLTLEEVLVLLLGMWKQAFCCISGHFSKSSNIVKLL